MPDPLLVVGVLFMVAAWLLIPVGVPGLWLMLGVLAVGALYGAIGVPLLIALAAVAAAAELTEFLLVRWFSLRYGGSSAAFWGAIVGGIVGVLVGAPVPVAGPILAGVAGTFVGAALVTILESGDARSAARVGWGVVLARALATGVKAAAGIVILVGGGLALLLG